MKAIFTFKFKHKKPIWQELLENKDEEIKYYQELILEIDKVDYLAVVLDSCGLCMTTGRIDLFVVDKNAIKDTTIIVKEITNDEMI